MSECKDHIPQSSFAFEVIVLTTFEGIGVGRRAHQAVLRPASESTDTLVWLHDIGDGTVVVRSHYRWSGDSSLADGVAAAQRALKMCDGVAERQEDACPSLIEQRRRRIGSTTFAFARVCRDLHPQFADDYFTVYRGRERVVGEGALLARVATPLADREISKGVTVWKDDLLDVILILLDPSDADASVRECVLGGDLDRTEAWWHRIAREWDRYRQIRNGDLENEGILELRDRLGSSLRALVRPSKRPDREPADEQAPRSLFRRIGDSFRSMFESHLEQMLETYHEITRRTGDVPLIEAAIATDFENLVHEKDKVPEASLRIAESRIRASTMARQEIKNDLATITPRVESVRTFIDSSMNQRIGLLTLFVVPLAMMQAVLAILQTGLSVGQTQAAQSSPHWKALGNIAPALLSVVIAVVFLPGILYSLWYAKTHHRMGDVGLVAIMLAVLLFLLPVAMAIAF